MGPPPNLTMDHIDTTGQGGDHSLPDRSETTCGLAGPPFFHLVWEPISRVDHRFSPFLTAPEHLRFWVDGHPVQEPKGESSKQEHILLLGSIVTHLNTIVDHHLKAEIKGMMHRQSESNKSEEPPLAKVALCTGRLVSSSEEALTVGRNTFVGHLLQVRKA